MELIELATDFGIINKAGAWYSFDFNGEEVKTQGMESMHVLLKTNPEKYKFVYEQVKAI